MPIMSDGSLQYEVPSEYRELITKEFLEHFAHILRHSSQQVEPTTLAWNYCAGTFGWYNSMCATIKSMGQHKKEYDEILEYYDGLPWYDSDMFDSELISAALKAGIIADEAPQE